MLKFKEFYRIFVEQEEKIKTHKTHFLYEAFDNEMGASKKIDAKELVDYINRVINRKEDPKNRDNKMKIKDYLHMPHIHASIAKKVKVTTSDGNQFDLDKFAELIKKRPSALLRQNEKMVKSGTSDTIFYNTSLPALKGLIIDEDTGEFRIVDTCPSAGTCQLICYAKHGSYILFPDVSLSQNKTLNYLFNDSEGFQDQLEAEIRLARAKNKTSGKQVQIRWNDSGDLLSPKFFKMVVDIANNTPFVDHYIYTKEVAMVKALSNPPDNIIFNFSYGGRKDQEKLIDPSKDKVSHIVDVREKVSNNILQTIKKMKYIEHDKASKKWFYNNSQAVKQLIAQHYKIDSDTLLTIDELGKTPKGENGQYNVIVLPGESDLSASRRDVRGTYLIIH
jgi:hypothetical protein